MTLQPYAVQAWKPIHAPSTLSRPSSRLPRGTIQYLEQKLEAVTSELVRAKSCRDVVYVDNGAAAVAAALSPSAHHPTSPATLSVPHEVRVPAQSGAGGGGSPQTGTYCRGCCPVDKSEQRRPVAPVSSVSSVPTSSPPEVAIGLAATVAAAAAAEEPETDHDEQQQPREEATEGAGARGGADDVGDMSASSGGAGAVRFHAPPPALPAVPAAQRAAASGKLKATTAFPHQLTAAAAVAAAQPGAALSEAENEQQRQRRRQCNDSFPEGRSANTGFSELGKTQHVGRAAPVGDISALATAAAVVAAASPAGSTEGKGLPGGQRDVVAVAADVSAPASVPGAERAKSSSDNGTAAGGYGYQPPDTPLSSLSSWRRGSDAVDGGGRGGAGRTGEYVGTGVGLELPHPGEKGRHDQVCSTGCIRWEIDRYFVLLSGRYTSGSFS